MKKHNVFVGVDVSKLFIDICVLVAGQDVRTGTCGNNIKGFKSMLKWIGEIQDAFFCMEHTGVYTIPLCMFLEQRQVSYALVPAAAIRRSLGIQRGKSDRADARSIARYVSLFYKELKPFVLPEATLMQLKFLLAQRDQLIKAGNLLAVPDKEIRQFADKQLLLRSKQAITPILRGIKKQITVINQQMQQLIASDHKLQLAYNLITSVPGVGPVIAIQMLVITRGFTIFDDPRKFACYCGIAPFEYSSGSSIHGKTRVSHLANKKMKSLLNMGALVAVRHDPQMRLYYQRKLGEGKNAMSVLNAIRNKLVHRVFATVRRETPFVPLARHAA